MKRNKYSAAAVKFSLWFMEFRKEVQMLVDGNSFEELDLKNHYVNYGLKEGRTSSPALNISYYVENNSDIKAAFGNDLEAAYNHFVSTGYKEYRKSASNYGGFFYKYYNTDLTQLSSEALIKHYVHYGNAEGRLAGIDSSIEVIVFGYTNLESRG